MGKIISMTERLEQRKEQEERERQLEWFKTNILQHLTQQEKRDLLTAIETKDEELYKSITNPIILRNALREANT